MSAMMEDQLGKIRVINQNAKTITGRYAGRDYVFKPKVPLDVPLEVARHIFDFGKEDKMQALNRFGWARTSDEYEAGMEMLNNVVFDDPPEMIEAPPKAKGKKKAAADNETGNAGPPVHASGTEGGEFNSPPNGPKIGEEGEEDEF